MNAPFILNITDLAIQDLGDIYDYIAQDSPRHAEQLIGKIYKMCQQQLAYFPNAGRERSELQKHLRSRSVGNYLIFSRFIDGVVNIERVVHESRDHLYFDELS